MRADNGFKSQAEGVVWSVEVGSITLVVEAEVALVNISFSETIVQRSASRPASRSASSASTA